MMAEFTSGELPWTNARNNLTNSESKKDIFRAKVHDIKKSYNHSLLLQNLPYEFNTFLDQLQSLDFEDKPNYPLLLGIFWLEIVLNAIPM